MGCLISCLRFKSDDRNKSHPISARVDSKITDPLVQRNGLSLLLLHKEEEGPPCEDEEHLNLPKSIDGELEHEAKFLKSCGALLETPIEIRKATEKILVHTLNKNNLSSNLDSQLSSTSCKKFDWDDEISNSTVKFREDSSSPVNKSECCKSEEEDKSRKFVHFEEVGHVSGDESVAKSPTSDIFPSHTDGQTQSLDSGDSPYPTPLNLADEMQTPGTFYPATAENLKTGKKARIRTQYVFPILKPVENLSQWKATTEDCNRPSDYLVQQMRSPRGRENVEQIPVPKDLKLSGSPRISLVNATGIQIDEVMISEEKYASIKTPYKVAQPLDSTRRGSDTQFLVPSLSQWLKPPPLDDGKNDRKSVTKEPIIDRPILGGIAANWNHDEPSTVSPKRWDGNGIPNTTTKYKEDQKVSWHATPFEVRLEKALTDDKLFPERTLPHGRPIKFDEGEESDIGNNSGRLS